MTFGWIVNLEQLFFLVILYVWCVCASVCVCLCYTQKHPQSFISLIGIKVRILFPSIHLRVSWRISKGVWVTFTQREIAEHRCGHGRCIPAPRESCGEFEGLRSCKTCHFTAGRPWASHLPSLTLCFFLWKYLPQRDVVSVKCLTWVKLESTRWKDCVFPGVLQLLPKWKVA